jgi:hypothetical protein
MKEICNEATREELAAVVVEKLASHGIDVVLVGGSVVSIYTENKYESWDLDFISTADHKRIKRAMSELGFTAKSGIKDFRHPNTQFTVEFPTGPLGIGDDMPVYPAGEIDVGGIKIKSLSPTQCVEDRLAWFFHFKDRQCLDQALWVAEKHPVDFNHVREWSVREKHEDDFQIFYKKFTDRQASGGTQR